MRHERIPLRRAAGIALEGEFFREMQRDLARFNKHRLAPGVGELPTTAANAETRHMLQLEEAFIEAARDIIGPRAAMAPEDPDGFVRWFEALRETGPGQGDALFPWLARSATREQMRWFLFQEVAGEAGFDDLVALTQVKMPARAKLEMARNYWDEMGRGQEKGMHGPMLERLACYFGLHPTAETTVPESLALGNMMMGLACNRHYAFHAVGALGAIEMTAPARAEFVAEGLRRIGVPDKQSHYFFLHAVLDVKHSAAWNAEVLHSLVAEDPRRGRAIAEGALLRLWCGQRCFERYRAEFAI